MTETVTNRFGQLDVRIDGAIGIMTIDRPEKLNAMAATFWQDLPAALDWLERASAVRAVIITGSGERAFCAGGDIGEFLALQAEAEIRQYQADAMAAFARVERSPLLVIAAVNGLAMGGGCELTMACDFVIAADSAKFAMPEASLGLVPGFGAIRAPELIGRQMTKYMIATGDAIKADWARDIGLVQLVVPAGRLMDEARAIAGRIADRSPNALRVAKRMVNRTVDFAGLDYSVDEISELQASEDKRIGVAAFLKRETPRFPEIAAADGEGRADG